MGPFFNRFDYFGAEVVKAKGLYALGLAAGLLAGGVEVCE